MREFPYQSSVDIAISEVKEEIDLSSQTWPPFNSAHEGFAVLMEEVEELWDHVKIKQKNRDLDLMRKEAKQIAAMAVKFMVQVCNEERGRR